MSLLTIDRRRSLLLVVDVQSRLMPAIHQGEIAVRNVRQLLDVARVVNVPHLITEENPRGLGSTVGELPVDEGRIFEKQFFDACREDGFLDLVPADGHIVVAGCEAHVCVLQTVLGLMGASRKTFVVRDAIGSRHSEDKEAALRRLERHGVEIVTTEMVIFEWLQTAEHPHFRQAIAVVKSPDR